MPDPSGDIGSTLTSGGHEQDVQLAAGDGTVVTVCRLPRTSDDPAHRNYWRREALAYHTDLAAAYAGADRVPDTGWLSRRWLAHTGPGGGRRTHPVSPRRMACQPAG